MASALALQAVCRDVEQLARAGELAAAHARVEPLRREYQRVELEINQLL